MYVSTNFELTDRAIQLASPNIDLSGYVTFSRLGEVEKDEDDNPISIIDGGNIITGTLSASKITTGTLNASEVTVSNLNADNITSGELSADYIRLYGEMYLYKNSTGTTYGGTFGYYQGWAVDDEGYYTTNGVGIRYSSSAGQLNCTDSGIWCGYGYRSGLSAYSSGVTVKGSTIVMDGTVQEDSAAVTSSDERLKVEVDYDMEQQIAILRQLKPCTYRRVGGYRRHSGLIAQEMEAARNSVGVDSNDYAALCINEKGMYGIRYVELVPALLALLLRHDKFLAEMGCP